MTNFLLVLAYLVIAAFFHKDGSYIAAEIMCFVAGIRFTKTLLKWTP